MVLHIHCTLIWEPLCDLQRTCFSKLMVQTNKGIAFFKSMGRHRLPLSGPWCPFCNKDGPFQIRSSCLRWNTMPSNRTIWWASYSCEAKFRWLYSPEAVSGCFDVMLLRKLKVLTKQVTAPWHKGERLHSDILAIWSRLHRLCCVSKSLSKA